METPKAQKGVWTLISPDGIEFKSDSPIKCCRKEQETRVPKNTSMDRLLNVLKTCDLCNEDEYKYVLAKGTPAEIRVCLTCGNTILQSSIFSVSKNEIVMPHTMKIY